MKLPPHRGLARSRCVTYRTYSKPLREPDGLTGPEAIPHCWRGGFADQAGKSEESTEGKSHRQRSGGLAAPSRWVSMQVLPREACTVTRGKGLQIQPKQNSLWGSGIATNPRGSLSAHWIYSWDNYLSSCAEQLGVSFSAEFTVAGFVTAPGLMVCLWGSHWRITTLATPGGLFLSAEGAEK